MKNTFIFLSIFAAILVFSVWFTDKSVNCDNIPANERYKYARTSLKSNKCVKMSASEIKNSLIEEQEENKKELEKKLLFTEVERDWAINEMEENSPD